MAADAGPILIVDDDEALREMMRLALPGPHAPIVAVTAGRDAAAEAREIDADGYLSKPFDLDQLTALVAGLGSRV